jgi:CRISPR-associated protein Cmr3
MRTHLLSLIIEPLDTLFFRDGRPFGPADHGASGLPVPQTFAGMIKTRLMDISDVKPHEMHNLWDNPNHPEHWISCVAVRGPWLADIEKQNRNLYFPSPVNFVKVEWKEKNEEGKEIRKSKLALLNPLRPDPDIDLPGWTTPHDEYKNMRPLIYLGKQVKVEPAGGYVTLEGMRRILCNEIHDEDINFPECIKKEELFDFEERTGIGIEPETQSTQEGMIYSARHLRLNKGIGFYLEIGFEKPDFDTEIENKLKNAFPEEGVILPLGGEGRRVLARKTVSVEFPSIAERPENQANKEEGGFATYLISPVIFYEKEQSGRLSWLPPPIGDLIAASAPKPLAISGWDLAGTAESGNKAHPKPTRFAVPAGAVYFWKDGKNAPEGREPVPNICQLSENKLDRAAGWGMALKGVWKYEGKENK